MSIDEIMEVLNDLLKKHDLAGIRARFSHMEPVDIAEILSQVKDDTCLILFRILPKDVAADTFSEMDSEEQQKLISNFTDQEVKDVLNEMYADDAVDMLEEMPANVIRRVLSTVEPSDRRDLNALLQYPEDSAGSVMTTEFVRLGAEMTISDSIKWIQTHGDDREDIYTCYVTDPKQKLLGIVTVRDMLLCKQDMPVRDIMDEDIISVHTTDDRESAAKYFDRYDFTALPVLDKEDRLVGIITVDDAIDVMTEEATEDFQKIGAMAPENQPYLKTPVVKMAQNRIVWLLVLMISDMISGGILGKFQNALTALPILITFIPMLTDTGGNAGSQSSTLVIRGLALHEIEFKDFFKILWKEIRVALICGFVLGLFNYIRLVIQYPGHEMVAVTVAIAMIFTVLMAKAIGGVLPLIATKFNMDPALMASPLITTIVDAASLLIYLNIARVLLNV
jgi:magnesium transporter